MSFQLIIYTIIKITIRGTTVPLYEFVAKQAKKNIEVKNFRKKLSTSRDGPVKSTETRKGWIHKKTIMLQKICGKQRLDNYSTSVVRQCKRSRVVFQSFFTMTFLQHDCLLVHSSLPCFCTFCRHVPTCT